MGPRPGSIGYSSRRDERKAVKEEYCAGRRPGQEGLDDDDMDAEGGKPEKAKKAWWKLSGD